VSRKFVDAHVEQTLAVRGYWRNLPKSEQDAVARRFWEVGRLTLEYWLTPKLAWDGIHRWPGTEVVEVTPVGDDELRVLLSDGTGLAVDRVVFGSGYRADLTKVPLPRRCAQARQGVQ
jgi:FAD-dependent urate hydroxylase